MADAAEPTTETWYAKPEVGGALGIRCAVAFYRLLGEPFARLVVWMAPYFVILLDRKLLDSSKKYLSRALGRTPLTSDSIRHIRAFAHSVKLSIDFWMRSERPMEIHWDGLEELKSRVRSAQGSILLGAHFGPIEACRSLCRFSPGLRILSLVHLGNSKGFRGLLREINPEAEKDMISVEQVNPALLVDLEKRLAAGESVAMLADRRTPLSPKRFIKARFLDDTASFPEGPFLIALLIRKPVYFLAPLFDEDTNTLSFKLTRLPDVSTLDRKQALSTLVAAYAVALEEVCRNHPYLFFNFFDFWRGTE